MRHRRLERVALHHQEHVGGCLEFSLRHRKERTVDGITEHDGVTHFCPADTLLLMPHEDLRIDALAPLLRIDVVRVDDRRYTVDNHGNCTHRKTDELTQCIAKSTKHNILLEAKASDVK